MGCSAEQTRINAQKSTGPRTDVGKAIVAKNAIKHGLWSQQPPILSVEDQLIYQDFLETLIVEYQAEGLRERLCVEDIAVAIWRSRRLWSVEAAAANLEILKARQKSRFNSSQHPVDAVMSSIAPQDYREMLGAEQQVVNSFIEQLTCCIDLMPGGDPWSKPGWMDAIQRVLETVLRTCPIGLEQSHRFWKLRSEAAAGLNTNTAWNRCSDRVRAELEQLLKAAKQCAVQRAEEEASFLAEEQAISEAEAARHGLQDPELFIRYEVHFSNQLEKAEARLERLQMKRHKANVAASETLDVEICETN